MVLGLILTAAAMLVGPASSDASPCNQLHPFWSPDGGSLIYYESCPEGASNVIRMALDGALETLTDDGRSLMPIWAPDGESIAFLRRGDPEIELVEMNLATRALELHATLVSDQPVGVMAWHPGGQSIAFTDRIDGRKLVRVVELASGQVRELPGGRVGDSDPAWRPDGTGVAVAHTETGTIVLIEEGRRKPLELGDGANFYPQFSPSGRGLFFISDRNGSPDAYYVELDGGSPCEIAGGDGFQGEAVQSSESGRVALVDTGGGTARLVVIENGCR